MVGDAAASFGVVIAGIIIALTGAYIADPIVSIIFAGLVCGVRGASFPNLFTSY